MEGVFNTIDRLGRDGVLDSDRVYASGFSQNSMFAAYTAICFPERLRAIWQGGSGLFVRGETDPLPQMEGVCRRSDFLAHGRACEDRTPCDDCQYWPAYPVRQGRPIRDCLMIYEDDFLYPTAEAMYRRLVAEAHQPIYLKFSDIGRGHSGPFNEWAWQVGCMGVTDTCSQECEASFLNCMDTLGGNTPRERERHYQQCFSWGAYRNLAGCEMGCSATIGMLRVVEEPCVVNGICDGDENVQSCPLDCTP